MVGAQEWWGSEYGGQLEKLCLPGGMMQEDLCDVGRRERGRAARMPHLPFLHQLAAQTPETALRSMLGQLRHLDLRNVGDLGGHRAKRLQLLLNPLELVEQHR